MQLPLTKVCSHCKIEKPAGEFNKNRHAKDGLHNECKACRHIYRVSDAGKACRHRDYQKHKAHYMEKARQYTQDHPDRKNRYQRTTYQRHLKHYREIKRYHVNIRRVQDRGTYTLAEWLALCEKQDYTCLCCGEKKPLTVDHVIPLSKGGKNTIDNIQGLCMDCNRKKHMKDTDYRLLKCE